MCNRLCLAVVCLMVLWLGPSSSASHECDSVCLSTKLDYLREMLRGIEDSLVTKEKKLHLQLNAMENVMHPARYNEHGAWETMYSKIRNSFEQITSMLSAIDNGMNTGFKSIHQLEENSKILLDRSKPSVRSCLAEPSKQSGEYLIKVEHNKPSMEVYCEQAAFGGGWIVIQQRRNGEEEFFRNWTDYRDGFGHFDGEFWLGLERLHQLTSSRPHELVVEIKDVSGNYGYAHYDEFQIGDEEQNYALLKLGKYNGTADDSLTYNKGYGFTTADRDNDGKDGANCAEERHGAWWYYRCSYANLNGRFQPGTNEWTTMSWYHLKKDYRGLVFSRMMVREVVVV